MPYDPRSSRQGMSRRERALGHQKGRMVSIGTGSPLAKDGSEGDFALRKTASGLKLYVKYANIWKDVNNLSPPVSTNTIPTFYDGESTPNIAGGTIFNTHGSSETITDFIGGVIGQTITIISKSAITYDVTSTNLKGGQADIATGDGDATTWIYDGSSWYLISWMNQSEDLADGSDGF